MSKKIPDKNYKKDLMTRRELVKRGAGLVAGGVAGAYLAFAPEHYPLSLRDFTGLRSMPQPELFTLDDFRVEERFGFPAVGVGRNGDTMERLRKALDAVGGITHFIQPGDVVLVKPNVAFDRSPILGATTHPEIVDALIRLLYAECRVKEVKVTDNPIESPADCFAKSGIQEAADLAGARVYLPDSNAFETLHTPGATLIEQWSFLKRPFRDVNKVIGLCPVKDHNLCSASMGMKNWYGLLGGRRNQFHQDIHEIVSDLSMMIKPTLTILDGTRVLMQSGPTGGDPSYVQPGNAVAVGTDPVALDAWAYENLLGRLDGVPEYLTKAEQKGSGTVHYQQGLVREVL